MSDVATVAAGVVAAVNGAAFAVGAWRWWRVEVESAREFWLLARAGQAAAALQALVAGVLFAAGGRPDDGLYWLYALLPVAVGVVAEQLRAVSAQTVLDARGLEDAAAVGRLEPPAQRSVVVAILRRELGVMTLGALAVAFLALRAIGTAGGM